MNKPLTRAEWLEWLDTTWKKCLHEAWDKEWAKMKEGDDTRVRGQDPMPLFDDWDKDWKK